MQIFINTNFGPSSIFENNIGGFHVCFQNKKNEENLIKKIEQGQGLAIFNFLNSKLLIQRSEKNNPIYNENYLDKIEEILN